MRILGEIDLNQRSCSVGNLVYVYNILIYITSLHQNNIKIYRYRFKSLN